MMNAAVNNKRFRYLTKKLDHFWSRWRCEYRTDLRELHRNNAGKKAEIQIRDMALVMEDNVKRSKWKMGKVEELSKGRDGFV